MAKCIKRSLVFAMMIAALMVALCISAFAATDGYYTYTVTDGEATITDVDTAISGDVTIPSTLGGYPVVGIGDSAFESCNTLTSIIIPDGVISIGKYCFAYCTSLADVTVPNGVTYIGECAFRECSSLTDFVIPNSVKTIDYGVFKLCYALESVTIPNGVTSIGTDAFYWCENLTSVTIPDSVTEIWKSSFSKTGITSIIIPDSVTSIGESVFYECSALTSVTIGNGVTTIGNYAFEYCSSLTSIIIPDNVTSIGNSAFDDCSSLTIYAEAASQPAGWHANWNYTDCPVVWGYGKATGVSLDKTSATLTAVGETLQLTATVTPDNAYDKSVTWTSSNTAVATVDANGLVTAVANGVATVTATTTDGGFTATCEVTVKDFNAPFKEGYYTYTVTNGEATITDVDTAISGDVTIPSTLGGYPVVAIGNSAVWGCRSLTSITIPDSVTSIGNHAFNGCSSLTNVIIGNGVTSIGNRAFSGCGSLTSITIPDSVRGIGYRAFSGCENLISVTIGNGLINIGHSVFDGCNSLQSIIVAEENTTYKSVDGVLYTKDGKTLVKYPEAKEDANYIVPNTVTRIEDAAFNNCIKLTSITIGDSVTEIKLGALYGCNSLTTISVAEENTAYKSIDGVLYTKNGKTLVKYPASKKDTSYVIPITVTNIENSAFRFCNNLTSVVIPDSVTSIGGYAFADCSNLTIYARATSAPSGWSSSWNYSNCLLVWGYGKVTSVILDKTEATLNAARETLQLSATVTPDNAINKSVTWTSSNTAVATVDANGLVTAVANGETTITVTTTDGGFTAACEVTVNIPEPEPEEPDTPVEPDEPEIDPTAPIIKVAEIEAVAGDTVEVTVSLTNNPGFSYIKIRLNYDNTYLTFVKAENKIEELIFTEGTVSMLWDGGEDYTEDNVLVTLTFTVSEDAPEGSYPITVICDESYNYDEVDVAWTIVPGKIEVIDFIYGDANGDGEVNGRDIIALRKYIANLDPDTGISTQEVSRGADANGDGTINGKDIIALRKYIANLDPDTGVSTSPLGPKE